MPSCYNSLAKNAGSMYSMQIRASTPSRLVRNFTSRRVMRGQSARWIASFGSAPRPARSTLASGLVNRADRLNTMRRLDSFVVLPSLDLKSKWVNQAAHAAGMRCIYGGIRWASRSSQTAAPEVPSFVRIRELANLLKVDAKQLFKTLGGKLHMRKFKVLLGGVPYSFDSLGNVIVPFQDAQAVAASLGKTVRFLDVDKTPERASVHPPLLEQVDSCGRRIETVRQPVVALLGHFNHGKTSILDALLGSDSSIAEREAGGITQEIRARTVSLRDGGGGLSVGSKCENDKDGKKTSTSVASDPVVTFLDTPGQEIFYRMRTNGAKVADVVVLVVSVIDGVCLQTSESIGCVEELGLPTVVALNKMDLLSPQERSQRLDALSKEIREFVAASEAQVIPISAFTGYGLSDLRNAVASALGHSASHDITSLLAPGSGRPVTVTGERWDATSVERTNSKESTAFTSGEIDLDKPAVMEPPKGAATATVLDYISNAKTGKSMLLLVDVGILRPGDWFVSGKMWGLVRSVLDEEGKALLEHAGPGVAVKVIVVPREKVADAPLGEPFRVLTKEAAQQVALVRKLESSMDHFIDQLRLEMEFGHLAAEELNALPVNVTESAERAADIVPVENSELDNELDRFQIPETTEDDLAEENTPIAVVVKADSANTLASVLDALRDCREFKIQCREHDMDKNLTASDNDTEDCGWRPKRRLFVSVARARIGAVTSSDVKLAKDCESPVFAHNVRPDSSAMRTLRRTGGTVVAAAPEGNIAHHRSDAWVGGEVVISETVGELLGEIERFALSQMEP